MYEAWVPSPVPEEEEQKDGNLCLYGKEGWDSMEMIITGQLSVLVALQSPFSVRAAVVSHALL